MQHSAASEATSAHSGGAPAHPGRAAGGDREATLRREGASLSAVVRTGGFPLGAGTGEGAR